MKQLGITFMTITVLASAAPGCKPDDDGQSGGNSGSGSTTPVEPICPGDDEVRYVSDDPQTCAAIRYVCNAGEAYWSDPECGCGCELPDCTEESEDFTYVSHDPDQCAAIRFVCEPGFDAWFSDCGCGCQRQSGAGEWCGGIMGKTCDEGSYCSFSPSTQCGSGDQTGTCEKRPEMCILIYKPVCGCDGHTYSNSCSAASAGVSVLHDGECSGTAVQN